MSKLLYSRRESAAALALSVRSVDLLIASGQLETVKVGARVMVTAESLKKLAENGAKSVRGE